ncbi:MAG: class I SAM-dependent methyltransferase [Chloroflexi bacterium]|nr:class I SAM-dependent methyltransferase [Chloroflexota bacterium]
MSPMGPAFYDDNVVFATYRQRRQRPDNPNDTLEKPVTCELIGPVLGQRVLDLGCGDADFGRELLNDGVAAYVGIEGSRNMVTVAQQTLAGTTGQVIQSNIEDWTYPEQAFDLVMARLVLHYIADLSTIFRSVHRTLIKGGQFVFSVEHPVITSCDRGWPEGAPRQDWIVDDYFTTGWRVTKWLGGTVQKYHRTIEDYFTALQQAGFVIEQLRESRPQREYFSDEQLYERRKRIPLFLFLAGRKR